MEPQRRTTFDPPKVGGDILAYCGRCKVELLHVVAAMVDGQPVRVQCKSCQAQHNYRRTTGVRKTATPKPRVPKTVVRVSELWEKKLSESKRSSVPYNPKLTFQKGDIVDHPKFGMGIVEEIRSNHKILIFFRDAERVLVHGMA